MQCSGFMISYGANVSVYVYGLGVWYIGSSFRDARHAHDKWGIVD